VTLAVYERENGGGYIYNDYNPTYEFTNQKRLKMEGTEHSLLLNKCFFKQLYNVISCGILKL
jgi:stringent starvation protein B